MWRIVGVVGGIDEYPVPGAQTEQGIQFALGVQGRHVVIAADVEVADEDLGDGATTAPADHLAHEFTIALDPELLIADALALQQRLGPNAIRTNLGGIENDLRHCLTPSAMS